MSATPLAARVVEVIADLGEGRHPRYRYGSGFVVAGRTVLTAAHVVAGAVRVQVRDANKVMSDASLDARFVGDVDGQGPDLALVEITTPKIDMSPMAVGAVDRSSSTGDPVERCHAIGYPTFMEREAPGGVVIRDTVDACGQVPVLSRLVGGLLSVQVSSTPKELPPVEVALGDSQWSGMSGGPLVSDGHVLGVVTEHAPREGSSSITATPLTALEADPAHPGWGPGVADPGAWWERLGVSGVDGLRRLPAQPERERPAYLATVREIHSRTRPLLGRQQQLAEITAFATGPGGYRRLIGGAWAGKTSLLAEAVATTLPEQVDVVSYFLSRREADADSARFLEAVVSQLAYLCDVDRPATDVGQFRALWERAAERADSQDRDLLLVVDGLDEDLRPPGLPSVAALLPSTASGRVHVLVGSRPYPELPSDVPVGHLLKAAQPVELEPFAGAQELADLARQEIDDLMRRDRDDDGLAADVLGLMTAAAGPLTVRDLATLTEVAPESAVMRRRIRRLITNEAARVLQPVGPADSRRYQFAHGSLLENAQANDDLNDSDFRHRIQQWAQTWHDADWPPGSDGEQGTPAYLLDTYSSTLTKDPQRLTALVSDPGWVNAAIQVVGADRLLAVLQQATAADPSDAAVAAMLETVAGQAHNLRPTQPLGQPGYVMRQLWLQAAELAHDHLADDLQTRLRSQPGSALIPLWTTRRASRALSSELGTHDGAVTCLAVLADGRVVTGGDDSRVLLWDPSSPGTGPVEVGRHDGTVRCLALMPGGRVVTTADDDRVLVWDPASPGAGPVELGPDEGGMTAVAALPDRRVVTGGYGMRVLIWDPASPGTLPVELGAKDEPAADEIEISDDHIVGLGVFRDGRVASLGDDGRVLIWDPATPGTDPVELGAQDQDSEVLALLPDGHIISGRDDGPLLVWDAAAPGIDPVELGTDDGLGGVLAVLSDGRIIGGDDDGRVLIWDPADHGNIPVELGAHDGEVAGVGLLPDGRVVSGGSDRRVLVWDPVGQGRIPASLGAQKRLETAVDLLPDGRVISISAQGAEPLIWDPASPANGPTALGDYQGRVFAIAVLPDGRVISGGNDQRVLMWDPVSPQTPVELGRHKGRVMTLDVLRGGRVVSGGDDRLLVWEPERPGASPVELGRHEGGVFKVVALPDGRVVSGGKGPRVLMWDPASPGIPVEAGRHNGRARNLAALPDGRLICGGSGPLSVWDPSGPERGPTEFGRHDGTVWALSVLPDGRVASTGKDGRVIIWDVTARTEIAQIGCSGTALATGPLGPGRSYVLVAHEGAGFSLFTIPDSRPSGGPPPPRT